jgi:undecaprenyl diphosphate synthase
MPKHVAIIMDGNGRWAKARHFPRAEGHRAGAKAVRRIVEESRRSGIQYLTLFAFSTENWQRPEDEVGALMKLFLQYLESEVSLLLKNDIRLRSIGDPNRLPAAVRESLKRCEDKTAACKSMQLVIAISYGARQEISNAAKAIAEDVLNNKLKVSDINEEKFESYLYTSDIPDPDLLIRTSDEFRISNFLLWQLAYSEIIVSPVLWPDFDEKHFQMCLEEFRQRKRRFGLTEEQIQAPALQNAN